MKYKILFTIISFLLNCQISLSQIEEGKKINLILEPDFLEEHTYCEYITISIENTSNDTLLTVIEPFSLYGLFLEDIFVIGPISSYFRPNEIYFSPIGYPQRPEGRGEYPLRFSTIPDIAVINPNAFLYLKILLYDEYKKFLSSTNWNLYCCVRYIEKVFLDSLIINSFPNFICQYEKSLNYKDTLNIWGIKTDSLFIRYNRDDDRTFKKLSTIDSIMIYFDKIVCYDRK